ncbi:MAG: CrcB family protein [Bdellovibrionales bacterium]|nr:CrcB family protein [Bdellovibrionales bacterium]
MIYVLMALLGAVGVLMRYFIVGLYQGSLFPWGTLIVNVLGSFFMGIYYGHQLMGHPWFPPIVHTAITVGLLGALTTYSTFSLDTIKLIQSGQLALAGGSVLLNTFLSLLGCYLGIKCMALFP